MNNYFPNIHENNVFVGDNLDKIPDINSTGSDFYTYYFQTDISSSIASLKECINNSKSIIYLNFMGVNYRMNININGVDIRQSDTGMFKSRRFHINDMINSNSLTSPIMLTVLVSPPDIPGDLYTYN